MKHIAAAFAVLLAGAALAHAEQMRAGKWEIAMSSKSGGEDDGNFTMTQCMTVEDLESQVMLSSEAIPAGQKDGDFDLAGNDGECRYNMHQKSGTLHVETHCSGEVSISDTTYSGEAFTMHSTIESDGESSDVVMTGKRLGDCEGE